MIEFGTVFGSCGNNAVDRLNITDIIVSKQNRTVDVEFADELSDITTKLARVQAKRTLGNVPVRLRRNEAFIRNDTNVMFYAIPKDKEPGKPEVIGRVQAEEMLIGRPIRNEEVVSIASINEGSGRVTITGRVFDADEREITSKKSGKEMHIVTLDVTDNTSSITVKMFVNKGEDDSKFKDLYTPISKALKMAARDYMPRYAAERSMTITQKRSL